jgi:hypothetical protein
VYGHTVPPILCLSYMTVSGHLQVQAAFLTRVNGKKLKVTLGQARGGEMYSSNLSLTSALDVGGGAGG